MGSAYCSIFMQNLLLTLAMPSAHLHKFQALPEY